MDSREIVPGTKRIQFFLDTASLDTLAEAEDSTIERFLRYRNHDDFDFVRTPEESGHGLLDDIDSYQIERNREENKQIILWDSENGGSQVAPYNPEKYEHLVNAIDWNGPEVSVEELELAGLFSDVSDLFSRRDEYANILVTASESILQNRRLLEYQIHRSRKGRMHIMTPSEASELAGIFMRRNDDFIFYTPEGRGTSHGFDFTLWYWTLRQVFIQHFTVDEDNYLGSMQDRFNSLLIGIDKLGEQYYRGTGNHTDLMTRYHFDYGISLLTGICDVLALHTRDKYNMEIEDRRTDLQNGHRVLNELWEHDIEARKNVQDNQQVIDLLHTVRNDIIHQTGVIMRGPGFALRDHSEATEWQSQTLSLEKLDGENREDFRGYYQQLDDTIEEYDPVTKWGVVVQFDEPPEINEHTQIEPYRFLKQATKEIADFTDEYLRLLGHPNRVQDLPDCPPTSKTTVEWIVEYGLHPFLDDMDIGSP